MHTHFTVWCSIEQAEVFYWTGWSFTVWSIVLNQQAIWLQEVTCASSSCSFLVSSNGTLTRSPSCNVSGCTGVLPLDSKGIRRLAPGVFSGLSGVTSMWVLLHISHASLSIFCSTEKPTCLFQLLALKLSHWVCCTFDRWLSNNNLTEVAASAFQDLVSLGELWALLPMILLNMSESSALNYTTTETHVLLCRYLQSNPLTCTPFLGRMTQVYSDVELCSVSFYFPSAHYVQRDSRLCSTRFKMQPWSHLHLLQHSWSYLQVMQLLNSAATVFWIQKKCNKEDYLLRSENSAATVFWIQKRRDNLLYYT